MSVIENVVYFRVDHHSRKAFDVMSFLETLASDEEEGEFWSILQAPLSTPIRLHVRQYSPHATDDRYGICKMRLFARVEKGVSERRIFLELQAINRLYDFTCMELKHTGVEHASVAAYGRCMRRFPARMRAGWMWHPSPYKLDSAKMRDFSNYTGGHTAFFSEYSSEADKKEAYSSDSETHTFVTEDDLFGGGYELAGVGSEHEKDVVCWEHEKAAVGSETCISHEDDSISNHSHDAGKHEQDAKEEGPWVDLPDLRDLDVRGEQYEHSCSDLDAGCKTDVEQDADGCRSVVDVWFEGQHVWFEGQQNLIDVALNIEPIQVLMSRKGHCLMALDLLGIPIWEHVKSKKKGKKRSRNSRR
jgi:hypothetical protein